jgi:hypothetical protein
MAGLRFILDLYIPESPIGTIVEGVQIPTSLATQIPAIREQIRVLKTYAAKINAGTLLEEASMKASFHICRHDEGKSCSSEQDI